MVVAHPQIQAQLVGHAMPDKVLCDIRRTAAISHSSQYTIHLNAYRRQQIPQVYSVNSVGDQFHVKSLFHCE
ncbi:hypothetical protein Q090_05938 [Pseudomonas aeruginosa C51]|nr:hypothetical protein Q090_05938 [Pseudomonas aeruginosa C51]